MFFYEQPPTSVACCNKCLFCSCICRVQLLGNELWLISTELAHKSVSWSSMASSRTTKATWFFSLLVPHPLAGQSRCVLTAMAELQEQPRRTPDTFTPALASCMLIPHWPKQVTWPFPELQWEILQSYMAKGKDMKEWRIQVIFAISVLHGSNGFQSGVWEGLPSIPLEFRKKFIPSSASMTWYW